MIILSPGPVYISNDILEAQTKQIFTHRSTEFAELYSNLIERTKKYLNAEEAHIITGSGTLGIESLIANLTKKEEKMLCLSNGVFGDRLEETARIYTQTESHKLEAGKGWNLERAKEIIDNSDAQIFGMVFNETGYGVNNKAKEIIQHAKKKGMITILDCVSAWPGYEVDMMEFGLDGFATASQKCLGCPPGLALVGLSKDAIERMEKRKEIPTYYINLNRYRKRYLKNKQTPNTPAITIMWALQKSFDKIDEQGGIVGTVKKHEEFAEYTRKRITELGFELIAEEGFRSNTLTSFKVRGDAKEIKKRMKKDFGIVIVGCKGDFAENGLRIAHMGYINRGMLDSCFKALDEIINWMDKC